MRPRDLFSILLLLVSIEGPARADGPTASASMGEEPSATAESDDSERPAFEPIAHTRRGGFTAGIYLGGAFGTVSGYPNDLSKIDEPQWRTGTRGVGGGGMFYFGGALTDWFTFGLGFASSQFGGKDLISQGGAFLFHIEAFPLFARGGTLRDVAVFADFGTGTATIKRRDQTREYSSSGGLSIAGLGAFWEPWRAGPHWVLGPFAMVQYQESDAMSRTFAEVGLRGTFYGVGH